MEFMDNKSELLKPYEARFNAVVLHYIDGKFLITIECKDDSTKEALTKKATQILKSGLIL